MAYAPLRYVTFSPIFILFYCLAIATIIPAPAALQPTANPVLIASFLATAY